MINDERGAMQSDVEHDNMMLTMPVGLNAGDSVSDECQNGCQMSVRYMPVGLNASDDEHAGECVNALGMSGLGDVQRLRHDGP